MEHTEHKVIGHNTQDTKNTQNMENIHDKEHIGTHDTPGV